MACSIKVSRFWWQEIVSLNTSLNCKTTTVVMFLKRHMDLNICNILIKAYGSKISHHTESVFQNKAIVGFISRVYYSIPMKLLHHLHDLTFHNIPIVLKILPVNLSAPGDLSFSSNCLSNNPASTLLNGFQLRPSIPTQYSRIKFQPVKKNCSCLSKNKKSTCSC